MRGSIFFLILAVSTGLIESIGMMLVNKMSRNGIAFGVAVSDNFKSTELFKKIEADFKRRIFLRFVIFSLAFGYLIVKLETEFQKSMALTVYIFAVFIVNFLLYLSYSKKVHNIITEQSEYRVKDNRIIIDTNISKDKLNGNSKSWWIYMIPLAILIISVFHTEMTYFDIPNTIAKHTDFYGNITSTMEKTRLNVISGELIGLVTLVLMLFSNLTFVLSKQKVALKDSKTSIKNLKRSQNIITYIFGILSTSTSLYMVILSKMMIGKLELNFTKFNIFTVVYVVIVVGGCIIAGLKVGTTGDKLNDAGTSYSEEDNSLWKLGGTIYFNPKDPSIFVPKRSGFGNTLNFGNKVAVAIFVIFILAIILLPMIIPH